MLRLLTTPWKWKRGMDDFSFRASRPADTRTSGFWPLQLWEKKNYVVLSHRIVAFVVIGYDGPGKWISIGSHNFTSGIYLQAFPSRSALSPTSSALKFGLPTIISALFLPKGPYHLLPIHILPLPLISTNTRPWGLFFLLIKPSLLIQNILFLFFVDTLQMPPFPLTLFTHLHSAPSPIPLAITTLLSVSISYVYIFFFGGWGWGEV